MTGLRSDMITKGIDRAPHRSLLRVVGKRRGLRQTVYCRLQLIHRYRTGSCPFAGVWKNRQRGDQRGRRCSV